MPVHSKKRIKVLVVDDSAVARLSLKQVLSADPAIEVMATAADPYIAARNIRSAAPDVITLDLNMPKMDGVTFLKKIMQQHPLPVVVVSSHTEDDQDLALKALDSGAVAVVNKPRMTNGKFEGESAVRICDAVKAAARAQVKAGMPEHRVEPKLSADVVLSKRKRSGTLMTTETIIVVGASTGGTDALLLFLEALPADVPGIVIVQHMPENFTASFARRLNTSCRIEVKEAEERDSVVSGRALIAPGDRHILLQRSGRQYYVQLHEGPPVSRHRPSVDVLFRSAANTAGKNVIGVIMTGMGDDGAKGMAEMKEAGACTIAQDEASCVVFGMPQEAIKLGVVDRVVPLQRIANEVIRMSNQRKLQG